MSPPPAVSSNNRLDRPEPFSADELAGATELRERLAQHNLPADLMTEFALARCWRANKGDCATAEQRVLELSAHLRAFGIERLAQVPDKVANLGFIQRVYERFSISRPDADVFSGDMLVFLQRMEGVDVKHLLRVVPLGHILEAYALLQLNWMRAVHAHEQRTGRPAAVVAVIDLQGLSLRDFMNPLSAPSRMARLIVRIWADYFTENLVRLYLVQPPGLLTLFWQVAKHVMDQRTWSKLVVVHKLTDLLDHLSPESLPVAWGGTRRDESTFCACPASCVSVPLPVLSSKEHFDELRWSAPFPSSAAVQVQRRMIAVHLKGNAVHESQPIECRPGDKLRWLFSSSGDVHFELLYQPSADGPKGANLPLWPRMTVTSLTVPEHGEAECPEPALCWVRFSGTGHGGWLLGGGVKLNYFLHKLDGP